MNSLTFSSYVYWEDFFLLLDWDLSFSVVVIENMFIIKLSSLYSSLSIQFATAEDMRCALTDITNNCNVKTVIYEDY